MDLKSPNILLSSDGQTAKLADFGLLQVTQDQKGVSHNRGICRGTPGWIAPEVRLGFLVCEQADIYALGVVIWCAIAFMSAAHKVLIGQLTPKYALHRYLYLQPDPSSTAPGGWAPASALLRSADFQQRESSGFDDTSLLQKPLGLSAVKAPYENRA